MKDRSANLEFKAWISREREKRKKKKVVGIKPKIHSLHTSPKEQENAEMNRMIRRNNNLNYRVSHTCILKAVELCVNKFFIYKSNTLPLKQSKKIIMK